MTIDAAATSPPDAPCDECNVLLVMRGSPPHPNQRLTGFRQPSGEETYRCLTCLHRLAFTGEGRKARWFKVYV